MSMELIGEKLLSGKFDVTPDIYFKKGKAYNMIIKEYNGLFGANPHDVDKSEIILKEDGTYTAWHINSSINAPGPAVRSKSSLEGVSCNGLSVLSILGSNFETVKNLILKAGRGAYLCNMD